MACLYSPPLWRDRARFARPSSAARFFARKRKTLEWFVLNAMSGARNREQRFASGIALTALLIAALLIAVVLSRTGAAQQIDFPQPLAGATLSIEGGSIEHWQTGAWDVYHVNGQASIQHGENRYTANEAILWVDAGAFGGDSEVLLYLDKEVSIDIGARGASNRMVDEQWLGRLATTGEPRFSAAVRERAATELPPVFQRAMLRRAAELQPIQPVQYVAPADSGLTLISPVTGAQQWSPPPGILPQGATGLVMPLAPQIAGPGTATTSVEILPRNSSMGGNVKGGFPGRVPGEQVLISTGGTRVNIDSQQLASIDQFGQPRTSRLVIQADNVVAWQNPIVNADGSGGTHYEIYLEGNVVFAMGNRVIHADRMYYDATFQRGTILAADVLTPVPSYDGLLRLKADVVQQTGEDQFQAYGAAVTSSRLGVPRYWLQSDSVTLTRQDRSLVDPATGMALVNPQTGMPGMGSNYIAESRDNTVYIGGVPVFYWPVLRTELDNPSYYIESVRVGNDSVFGTRLGVGLDMFQLLGIANAPENVKWIGQIDYLSERGLGLGSDVDYRTWSFFGIPGQVDGILRAWFIDDSGLDNLGRDRRMVPLEEDLRGRILARHRHIFSPGYQLRAEAGWLSDRNFLEQYYESEWDEDKDYTTGLWLQRNVANQSFNLVADVQVNDFFTQTQWLPRGDHFVMGQPLFFDRAVWHAKSTIGYGEFRTADPPVNAVDLAKFDPLAWEGVDREGLVGGTRQELDFPVQLGAVRVVPYVLGDASFWQEDLSGQDLFRAYGQAGIRTSLPLWAADPTIHSTLLNLNGLAHKVTWETEYLYADASQNLDELPLYHQLDDDAQEAFRRRFAFDTFGIVPGMNVPVRFDERYFAHRSALQSNVTSPAMEIADDLTVIRSGFRNRWQTKRGLPGEARIIDWVTFDVRGSYFPRAERDNFGEDVGLVDYDFRWHIGDRLSLVSDGFFDFFSQGLRTASLGAEITRPGVGNVYLGVRTIEGPVSSNILSAAAAYRMSDKWVVRGNSSIDFGSAGNIGQSLSFVRIGESFLVQVGFNADTSRDNVGFVLAVEPRFVPGGRLGTVGGQRIPPASANYLE